MLRRPHLTLVVSLALLAGTTADAGPDAPTTTKARVEALAAPVQIDFDGIGVPTVRAGSLEDLARAQGWVHARDRFLQMDLARRQAAGELAEIFPPAREMDRAARPLGMRAIAVRALAAMKPEHRALLERYAEGVNAQLASTQPLEYRMLRQAPAPWRPEDTLLVQLGMGRYLDNSALAERERARLFERLPAAAAAYLSSSAGALSMSVDGSPLPAAPAIPGPELLDIRPRIAPSAPAPSAPTPSAPTPSDRAVPGSNAFAVAGTRTTDGRAILGNDMHLALTAPGLWYRIALEWPGGRLMGVSLPGVPLIVQGTNGAVAWGFTNLTADLSDLVIVETDPNDPARYRIEGGSEPFVVESVTLGRAPRAETLECRSTRFGPVVADLGGGRLAALRSPMLAPGGLDCGLFDLCFSRTIEDALKAARAWNGPAQNVLVAGADGRIGWTISGALPKRVRPGAVPTPWNQAAAALDLIKTEDKPMVVDPPSGVLTSANQLAIAPNGPLALVLGFDEASGDRARRLRTMLEARRDWTEAALHEVQLDTYSARLVRWRDAILALVPADAGDGLVPLVRRELSSWDGRIDAGQSASEVLDAFRRAVRAEVAAAIGGDCANALEDEALLRAIETRAAHLAPDAKGDWSAAALRILAGAAESSRILDVNGAGGIRFRSRGEANIASIRHPVADALGPAAKVAEMPRSALPGHPTVVRVQTPSFGASQRSVVSPAHPADAILVTPCGQASMPTSVHFRDCHPFWEQGRPYPLVPGEAVSKIELSRDAPIATETPRGRPAQSRE